MTLMCLPSENSPRSADSGELRQSRLPDRTALTGDQPGVRPGLRNGANPVAVIGETRVRTGKPDMPGGPSGRCLAAEREPISAKSTVLTQLDRTTTNSEPELAARSCSAYRSSRQRLNTGRDD